MLIGHSGGGGLTQYTVDVHGTPLRNQNWISGMIGVDPFPPQGGLAVCIAFFVPDHNQPLSTRY